MHALDSEELNPAGRAGLFAGGYLALAVAAGAHAGLASLLSGAAFLRAVLAGGLAIGMLHVADRSRATELEPFGVVAAFGSTIWFTLAVADLGRATGADGPLLFWAVVLVALPVSVATLLWLPHPILGINVAVGAAVFVIAAPLGDGRSAPGAKALLLGIVLLGLALVVDLRTSSRAGSLLHYAAIAVLSVAKLMIGIELDPLLAAGAIAALGLGELVVGIVLRRRSWAVSAWVTSVLAGSVVLVSIAGGALAEETFAGLVALPLLYVALLVHREGDVVRHLAFDALPPPLVARLPG
ncbi:MAG: hypothetical protein Q8K58_05085 [Acidimicrobiales bacterium]|nr:hypothetical protein [Acidimicrobiales bacterium]